MQFCIRREIDFANCEERLRKVGGVPIELALPPKLEHFESNRGRLDEIERLVREFEIPVRSVYASHGRLAGETFRTWAGRTIQLAEAVGAGIVVFHPEVHSGGKPDEQAKALLNIKYLQDRTRVTIAVETFWDRERVLTPDDIMEHHLPMVLDTSLIPRSEAAWIAESYHTHLMNVHLSGVTPDRGGARGAVRKFRPIDSDNFCMDLLDRLYELEWRGVVTLEYVPWLADKSMDDRRLLEMIYQDS